MKYIKPEITIQEIEVQLPMATSIGDGGKAPDVTTDTAPDVWENIW